jgi:hypothetical protein
MKAGVVAWGRVSGEVQVATWFGASELAWKMTRVVHQAPHIVAPAQAGSTLGKLSHT